MKNIYVSLMLISFAIIVLCLPGALSAQTRNHHSSSNSKYKNIRTKQRANLNFTNMGKVFYHHVSDADVTDEDSSNVGNIVVRKGREIEELDNGNIVIGSESGIRQIYTATQLRKINSSDNMVKVGNITVKNKDAQLDRVENIVHIGSGIKVD